MVAEHGTGASLNGAAASSSGPSMAAPLTPWSVSGNAADDADDKEWIEITDPQSQNTFYANPTTGECRWDRPENGRVRLKDSAGEWWELYDDHHGLPYYYNTKTGQTDWLRPTTGTVIPLAAIQNSALGKRVSVALQRGSGIFDEMKTAAEPSNFAHNENSAPPNIQDHSVDPNQHPRRQSQFRSTPDARVGGPWTSAHWDQPNGRPGMPPSVNASELSSPAATSATTNSGTPATIAAPEPVRYAIQTINSSALETGGLHLEHARKSLVAAEVARKGGVSEPIVNEEAALRMSPVKKGERGSGDYVEPEPNRSSLKSLPPELQYDINQFQIDGFAKKYFSTHKQGLFRRKVPVEKMLNWTKDSLKQPLIVLNKSVHKDALKCFKNMQRIMGDRPRKSNKASAQTEEIQWILNQGILHGELRDEIYVQLCKQLTNNPHSISIRNGWELMCVILVTFPPSKNFENYLHSFVRQHETAHAGEDVGQLAKYAVTRLRRICKVGPRGKVPTPAEIDRAREAPFKPSVFGESLEDIMRSQRKHYTDLYLPRVLPFLAEAILQLGGQKTEGIFRVPGDADEVTELKVRLENGKYDLSGIQDPNVPTSLLKLWLRDLAEPLIPEQYYSDCLKSAEDVPRAVSIIGLLPETNKRVVHYIINFLQLFAKPEIIAFTKMNVGNLGMVMAPNFLRCPSENLALVFENTKFEQAFMRTLIMHLRADPMEMRL